jgi:hypothetical protein
VVKQFISNITQNYVKTNIRLIGFVFVLLIAIFALYGGYKLFHRGTIEEHIKTPPMGKITNFMGTQNTKTTVGYVKKEIINGVKEDTDVEANIEQPKVTVKVNGKKQQFNLKQNETQKFEDGKVVMNQTSEVTFDVKVPERHELNVYAQEEFRAGKFHHQVGIEKENGKFVYGAKYDLVDKEPLYYARYNLVKMYTN